MTRTDRLLAGAAACLDPGEHVRAAVSGAARTRVLGTRTVRPAVLVVTDTRVVLFLRRLVGSELRSVPLAAVTSVERTKDALAHGVTIVTPGSSLTLIWIADEPSLRSFLAVLDAASGPRA